MSFRPPPAQAVHIDGAAGRLEGLLEEPAAVAGKHFGVICHPHPLHGGTMHNKVVHTLARSLHQWGAPTLRFNFRGVGASEGQHDEGRGETGDALAVIAWGRARWPAANLVLAGFSFGAVVALRAAQRAAPAALITIAPAVDRVHADDLAAPDCPWLIVQGEGDEVVASERVLQWARARQAPPQLALLPGVGHFFHGALGELSAAVLGFLNNSL